VVAGEEKTEAATLSDQQEPAENKRPVQEDAAAAVTEVGDQVVAESLEALQIQEVQQSEPAPEKGIDNI